MTKYRTIDCIIVLVALATGIGIRDSAAASVAYSVTDLGSLGGTESRGQGINASGQVAGLANITGDGFQHAFLWTPTTPNGVSGTMQDLGTLGGNASSGYGINDSGQVTGFSYPTGEAVNRAFLWSPTTPGGISGSMHDLGTSGGTFVDGRAINDSGQVSGSGYPTGNNSFSHALLWTPSSPYGASGTAHDLGTLGGSGSNGYGINAGGQVVGQSGTSSGFIRAFLWTPSTPNGASGSMINLGTLGGNYYSIGQDINDQEQVVGSANTTGDTATHAFLYDGTIHDLGTLGGNSSEAYGINAGGQVVGYSSTTGSPIEHAFLYTSGGSMIDLNTLIDPLSGWLLQVGNGINDAGQITGYGTIGGQQNRAFLLTPVPEPASFALLALGLLFFISRRAAVAALENVR